MRRQYFVSIFICFAIFFCIAIIPGLVQRDSGGNLTNIQNTNLNAGGVDTAGIDVDLRWQIAKSPTYGTFSTHLIGTYLTKFDETLPDGTVQPSIGASLEWLPWLP